MPAGVNSPVRAFLAVGGTPPLIDRGEGAYLWDIAGRRYIDYVGSWGPAILGHAHPKVVEAVNAAALRGLGFGATTPTEIDFAERINALVPSMEMLRCVSSGTEATMSALRVARGATGRDVIIKFEGGYHGHSDALLVRAGSGVLTFGAPDSAGVPSSVAQTTWTLPFNDTAALRRVLTERGSEVAAVIVEPVAGNMGCVPPRPGFLEAIVAECRTAGALSVFDEVMTGCRVARGGAQELFGLTPDLTCLGKVVGGGLPLAVYGGRRELMQKVAPLGPVYQAGTLSGNPVCVCAGLATLGELGPPVYERLESLGQELERGLRAALARRGVPGQVQRVGSMLTLFFAPAPVVDFATASRSDRARFAAWHRGLLERGIFWPPSQFEAAFLSAAHTASDIERTLEAAEAALGDLG